MKEEEEGYCMPLTAPSYTPPPFWARPEGKILMVFFQADEEAMGYETPEPLELTDEKLALAWIGDMVQPTHTMGLYHECLTALKVKYGKMLGWYINYIWVSHDMALLFEREIYGWPAQLCENIPLRFEGSQIFGVCRRYDEDLMRISMNITSPPPWGREKPLEDEFNKLVKGDFLQIRKFPSPEKDGKPLKQLLFIPTTDFKLHEIWSGPAVLEFGTSGYYPLLHKLRPTKILGAYYVRAEWIVPHAKIIWEKK